MYVDDNRDYFPQAFGTYSGAYKGSWALFIYTYIKQNTRVFFSGTDAYTDRLPFLNCPSDSSGRCKNKNTTHLPYGMDRYLTIASGSWATQLPPGYANKSGPMRLNQVLFPSQQLMVTEISCSTADPTDANGHWDSAYDANQLRQIQYLHNRRFNALMVAGNVTSLQYNAVVIPGGWSNAVDWLPWNSARSKKPKPIIGG